MEIYSTSSVSASMAVSNMVGTAKKIIQFGILVFLEAREINLRGNLQGSKCDEYCIFLWDLFSFYEKVIFLLTLYVFSKYF